VGILPRYDVGACRSKGRWSRSRHHDQIW